MLRKIDIRIRSSGLLLVAVHLLLVSAALCQTTNADNVVLRWNQAALDSIVATRTAPAIAARALAILHTCIFDAWAAYDDTAKGTQLGGSLRQPLPERNRRNKEKAISFAAYRALADLFPSQTVILLAPLMKNLGYDPSDHSSAVTYSAGIGNVACQAVLDFRHADGSNQLGDLHSAPYSDYTGYTSANRAGLLTDPNRWQPLVVNGTSQIWQLPHWGQVRPFALASGSQFRSQMLSRGPIFFPSEGYWKQANEVIQLSAQLSDREKVIAEFWADGATTVTPPGHWNLIAQFVSRRDHHSVDQDVKLFFMLGNSLLDTSITTWDVKRYSDSVRPATVIRFEMGKRTILAWAGPGLGTRTIDCKDFRSYLPTPPFGGYVSGHSAFSAAAAEVLKRFSGSDYYGDSFIAPPGSSIIEPGLTPKIPLKLQWDTFTIAADQAGISRRYGGIHFEADDLAGRQLGRLVAVEVWNKAMTYIDGSAP
jgi:hypothetical protein